MASVGLPGRPSHSALITGWRPPGTSATSNRHAHPAKSLGGPLASAPGVGVVAGKGADTGDGEELEQVGLGLPATLLRPAQRVV